MARRRRGRDWEGIVRGIGALVLLGVGFVYLNGGSGGRLSDSGSNPLAGFFGVVVFMVICAIAVAVMVGLAFIIWKVFSMRDRSGNDFSGTDIQPSQTVSNYSSNLSVSERLDALDWFQLEKLVGALFLASGYRTEFRGGANADGGIDLIVENADGRLAVQCKHWGKWKCGVGVVRELMGAMLHEGIPQGYLIAAEITPDARELAAQHSIGIMDREALIHWIEGSLADGHHDVKLALEEPEKLCPKCGSTMIKKTSRKGKSPGSSFWGCSRYPKCKQTMNL